MFASAIKTPLKPTPLFPQKLYLDKTKSVLKPIMPFLVSMTFPEQQHNNYETHGCKVNNKEHQKRVSIQLF